MTEPSNYTTCGRLKTMYYDTFADYHIKFIEHYEAQGIPIWGITTTNEPANGFLPLQKFNCLAWTAHHMGLWIISHLGPRIRGSRFKHIKILGIDDQRHTIPLWFIEMLEEHPMVLHYLDGVGIHAYSNLFAPPEQLTLISRPHPDKFIMATEACEDQPCVARSYKGNGTVCVCTAEYCDTVTREALVSGRYVAYVSSEGGLRFHKYAGNLLNYVKESFTTDYSPLTTLEVDVTTKYQTIEGFGGGVSDSAGINWKNLTDPRLMQHLIDSYCGDSGIQYNMLRVPIGGTDYSTRGYAYNELPEDDATLSNFTLAYEDYEYKIPMIKACMAVASASIHIVSTTWSPPIWMKTNNEYSGHSRLKKQYLQTYADYHYKFLEKYADEGIPVWGITTTNEPLHSSVNYIPAKINNMGWTLDDLSEFIVHNLGPTLRNDNSSFKDIKIITGDDLRFTITLYWNTLVLVYPETLKYLDGVAVHYYMNKYVPPTILSQAMAEYPDKFVLATEICAGALPTDTVSVDYGSWSRAELYINDIIENLSNNVIGWLDWNLCLNTYGGPSYINARVDSPIIVNATAGEFYKQPMFYAIGHFSKFVPRGSQRIKVTFTKNTVKLQSVAFLTPYNTVVIVIWNKGAAETVRVRLRTKEAEINIREKSISTVEMLNE